MRNLACDFVASLRGTRGEGMPAILFLIRDNPAFLCGGPQLGHRLDRAPQRLMGGRGGGRDAKRKPKPLGLGGKGRMG